MPKYFDSGWAKYQPETDAVGYIAMLSVKETPVNFSAFKSLNSVGFSRWSGQAG